MRTNLLPMVWAGVLLLSCAALSEARAASVTATLTDREGKPLQRGVVYVMPATGKAPDSPTASLRVTQKDMEFVPPVSVVRVGSKAEFPNLDPVTHHVRSFSHAKEFSFFLKPGEPQKTEVILDKPGPIVFYCMLHERMRGFIYVLDTPWHAQSDGTGTATISGLPAGSYRVYAWHPEQGHVLPPLEQSLTVAADGAAALRFEFPVRQRRRRE
ncbi:MAG: methylamine utilization protein [Burkholderiales bacterium]|nr:methylamine utilization protein [Burkholderiales bacterium]